MRFNFDYRQFVSGYYYSSSKVKDDKENLLGYYRVQENGLATDRRIEVSFTWAKDGMADLSREVVSVSSDTSIAAVLVEDCFTKKVMAMNEALLKKIQNLEK